MTADDLAAAVGTQAGAELTKALERIEHCLAQLTDEQIWWRSKPDLNSIGNLILHLCGNVRQWIIAGLGDAVDERDRPQEFSERGPIPRAELVAKLRDVVAEAKAVMSRQSAGDWSRRRRIQGFEVTGLEALFDSVPHFRGHAQEIVGMTRLQLGNRYRFAWTPVGQEQGAPK